MSFSLSKWWRWIAYAIFAICVFGMSLYLTFPSSQFHRWMIAELERELGADIVIQQQESHSPLWLTLNNVVITMDAARLHFLPQGDTLARRLQLELLSVKIHLSPLLFGKLVLSVEIKAFDGVVTGTLTAVRREAQTRYTLLADIQGLNLQQIEETIFTPRADKQLLTEGVGTLGINVAWTDQALLSGGGTLSIDVHDIRLNLPGFPALPPARVSGHLLRDQGDWWQTDDVMVNTNDERFIARGQGRFRIGQPLVESTINLSLSMTMDEAMQREYPALAMFMANRQTPSTLTVTGKFRRPVVVMNGVPIRGQ